MSTDIAEDNKHHLKKEVSKHMVLNGTETVRLIRDGEKVSGGEGAGTEGPVGGQREIDIPIATLSPPE